MGLKLFGSNVEPPLCKGSTLAIFSMTGKTPVKNDTLIMWHSGITIKSTTTLSIFNGILQGPEPLLGKDWINSRISSFEIWAIMRLNWFLSLRYLLADIWLTFGILLSNSGPTLTKKSLTWLAISLGSATVFPLIFSWDKSWLSLFLTLTIDLIPCHVFLKLLLC